MSINARAALFGAVAMLPLIVVSPAHAAAGVQVGGSYVPPPVGVSPPATIAPPVVQPAPPPMAEYAPAPAAPAPVWMVPPQAGTPHPAGHAR